MVNSVLEKIYEYFDARFFFAFSFSFAFKTNQNIQAVNKREVSIAIYLEKNDICILKIIIIL